MDAVRILILQAGNTVKQGAQVLKDRGILVISPEDIESVYTETKNRTGFRTRSGAWYVSPLVFEPFLVWLSDEIRRWEAREMRETSARKFREGEPL